MNAPRLVVAGFLALLSCASPVRAQPLGLGNDRSHPELHWMERETEHFVVIYHQGLEETAVRAATIAEQVYGPITQGLEVEMGGKTSILLSAEDETVNGFALPRRMFVWVHVNDFAARFGSEEKWLRLVIAHEFQHVAWMEAAQDWTGVWSLLGTPGWFVEGLAEHCTEEWGAYRSDLQVRGAVLRNRHQDLDPHDSGFSMVRYLAAQYGDSAIVRSVQGRGALGLADFDGGFRKATGIDVSNFEEEWRRAATAYTYALYGQKEAVGDVGTHVASPVPRLQALAYAPNGRRVAAISRPADGPALLAVAVVDSAGGTRDSSGTRARYGAVRIVDHGVLDTSFAFDGDGTRLVYAKMHRVAHGSLVWDLKVADLEQGTTRWITHGRRASHPHWSPRDERIVFTAIDGATTNLYTCAPDGGGVRALTEHGDDVQVLGPRFDAAGQRVAYSRYAPGEGLDLVVLDTATGATRAVTKGPARDLRPLWSPDGARLFFTSERNADEVPNVYTVNVDGNEPVVECLTDVGEAIFAVDVRPDGGDVVAVALATTDSVRLRRIPADRRARVVEPAVAARFVDWRERAPAFPLPTIDMREQPEMTPARPYRPWRHPTTLGMFVLPSPDLWGLMAGGLWLDTAHRHSVLVAADAGSEDESLGLRWLYGRWDGAGLPFGMGGFFQVSGGLESRLGLRLYDGDLLWDRRDHATLGWRLPLNWGEHLYAQHELNLRFDWTDVTVEDPEDFDIGELAASNLPAPRAAYRESKIEIAYRYRKRRPHFEPGDHPRTGQGFLARFEWADEALGSDVEYRRASLDASKAWGFLPRTSLFARLQGQAVWGEPAAQDFTGLRADPPILPLRYGSAYVVDDVVTIADAYAPRGYARNVPGEQALMTTIEWRLALVPALPVSAFGVSLGGVTGVLFYDQGRVWNATGPAAGAEAAPFARHTVGWEVRVPLRFMRRAFLVPSYGEGQTLPWERDGAAFERDEYFRFAMVRPF